MRRITPLGLFFFLLSTFVNIFAQNISFNAIGLDGENINNPTSLDFGPDGKLYVSQQNGLILQYDISRDDSPLGQGKFSVASLNNISIVKEGITNHNDQGEVTSSDARQVTGILAMGTSQTPILYVTSSDNLNGGGNGANNVNLDTNSGILSKLTWNGSSWDKIDLVRGLPRSEEKHSINGIDFFTKGGEDFLLLQSGGNTNKGVPSNNFVGTPEYYLSAATLLVNLTQLESMSVYTDPRTNTEYVYDLPTLNDPTRDDIDNTDSRFPYPSMHPMYNATIDVGDPFGGNDGLNQAFEEEGGPVRIFAPGFRNPYDILVTKSGKIYTYDNGPNTGWGGLPLIYNSSDQLKGTQETTSYAAAAGDYIKGEFSESGSNGVGDALHYIGTINDEEKTYYGGHPNPIYAFPNRADIVNYQNNSSTWEEISRNTFSNGLSSVSGYFKTSFSSSDFNDDDRAGEYLAGNLDGSKVNILDVINSSTNGICEYTASTFDNALKGNIFAASFNGNITRYELDNSGTGLSNKEIIFSGFGAIPLDIIALDDDHEFAGTLWAVTFGADDITIFEPTEVANCIDVNDPLFEASEDYDLDGFTNQDEIDNGTNYCSAASFPNDNDNDKVSDLNDLDDDNDSIPDAEDAFAIDPNNGLTTQLPIRYSFFNDDPGIGFFGLGFTGLMLDPSGNTDYLNQYDENNISFGGASGKASVDLIPDGTANLDSNDQEYAFQFGIDIDDTSVNFTIHSEVESPFFGINGSASSPQENASIGIFIGTGDQDNFMKVVVDNGTNSNDSVDGISVLIESDGVSLLNENYDVANLLENSAVDLYITVEPSNSTALVFVSSDGGNTILQVGAQFDLPSSFFDGNDQKGLAVGIIASSEGASPEFSAIWDYININSASSNSLEATLSKLNFGVKQVNSGVIQRNIEVGNVNDPNEGSVEITSISITGVDSSSFTQSLVTPQQVLVDGLFTIPITLDTDMVTTGVKEASLEIVHSGSNSPLIIPLEAIVDNEIKAVGRINCAGDAISVSDLDWNSDTPSGANSTSTFTVNTGNFSDANLSYSDRNSSIPDYITESVFEEIFRRERWDPGANPEMEYTIPISNGDYTLNLYMGNSFSGTSQVGQRVFNILVEGQEVETNFDLAERFGHRSGGMVSYPITISNGVLNVEFDHVTENPLINGIEVLESVLQLTELQIEDISTQTNNINDLVSVKTFVTGGIIGEAYTFLIKNQPEGIFIDASTGVISGEISANANGSYEVEVIVSQESGSSTSKIFEWNVNGDTNSWVDLNEDENYTPRHECSFVQAGDQFILFGGRESAQKLDVYDFENDTWSEGGMAPFPFNHFQAITYKGLVWVIGAFQTNSFPNETPATHIYMYNPATRKWIQGMEIPSSRRRGGAGLVVHNDKFYILGGNTDGHDGGYVNWFDVYDPVAGTWTTLANAPHQRDHFQAIIEGDRLYAIGGRLSGGAGGVFAPLVPEVDVYDFNNGTWSSLPVDLDLPTPRAGASVVNFESELFVIGGEGTQPGPAFKKVEAYDPDTSSWSTKSSLNHGRHGTQAIVSGNGIYILGGSPNRGGGNQRNMEVYGVNNPSGNSITATSPAPEVSQLSFIYNNEQAQVDLVVKIENLNGDTAAFLGDVSVSGEGFSVGNNSGNRLIESNQSLDIEIIFNRLDLDTVTGNLELDIDGSTVNVSLEGVFEEEILNLSNFSNDFEIGIYPNPVEEEFRVLGILKESIEGIQIYDQLGRPVFEVKHPGNTEFNMGHLASGVYLVRIEQKNGVKISKSIVVK